MTRVAGVLARGRRAAESLMVDTCTIKRPDPEAEPGQMDPDTMQYPATDLITVYTGPCRVQVRAVTATPKDVTVGERVGGEQTSELQLPVVGSEDVAVNDVVTIVTAANDASMVGRTYTVTGRHEKTHATARRLALTEGVR